MRHMSGRDRAKKMLADAGHSVETTVRAADGRDLDRPSGKAMRAHSSYDDAGYDMATGLQRGGVARKRHKSGGQNAAMANAMAQELAAQQAAQQAPVAPQPQGADVSGAMPAQQGDGQDPTGQPAFRRGGNVRKR